MLALPAFFFLPFDSGLGNQLFIAAAASAYSEHSKRKSILVVDRVKSQKRHGWFLDLVSLNSTRVWTGLTATLLSRTVNLVFVKSTKFRAIFDWQTAGGAQEEARFFESRAIIFRGYFQTSNIKVPFEFHPPHMLINREFDPAVDVAIHVRRGDYLDPLNRERYGLVRVADLLREGSLLADDTGGQLVVFSDSPELVRRQISELPETPHCQTIKFISGGPTLRSPIEELALMSEFQNLVISNSTFSLWAGRLGSKAKSVVAPRRWFKSGQQPRGIIPRGWKAASMAHE